MEAISHALCPCNCRGDGSVEREKGLVMVGDVSSYYRFIEVLYLRLYCVIKDTKYSGTDVGDRMDRD